MATTLRPTKKQRELLEFIEQFIGQHGYSPSYREIMNSLHYTSVATVALHVNNLIARGHLRKREHAARSLEVVKESEQNITIAIPKIKAAEEKWLIDMISDRFKQAEAAAKLPQSKLDELFVLVGALKVLELDGAVNSLVPRLNGLREKAAA